MEPMISVPITGRVLALCLFSAHISLGAEPYQPSARPVMEEPWRWHRMPELDGERIRPMAEDRAGNMWFALGSGGVLRYDGLNWTATDPIPGAAILDLYGGRDGQVFSLSRERVDIWVGAWKPLWKNGTGVNIGPSRLAEFPDGRLLVQCQHGLLVIEGERMEKRTFYTSSRFIREKGDRLRGDFDLKVLPLWKNPDEVPVIRQIAMDAQGGIAIAIMPNLVAVLSADGDIGAEADWRTFPKPAGSWDHHVSLHAGRDGVWAGELKSGWLASLDTQEGFWTDSTRPGLYPTDIIGGAEGELWVSGPGRLDHFDGNAWSSLDIMPRGSAWAVDRFFMGAGDQLWCGLAGGITWRVDVGERLWQSYQGLHYQGECADGRRWYLAGDGSVVERFGEDWRRHTTGDGLIDKVRAVICAKDGKVWAAGSHQGTAAAAGFDGTRWQMQTLPELGKMADYRSFHEGGDGRLHIGASNSVSGRAAVMTLDPLSDDLRWEAVPGSAAMTNAIDIAGDSKGRLWFGGHTLSILPPGSMDGISYPGVPQDGFVDAVEFDHGRDTVWVATRGRGLDVYDGIKWGTLTIADGLATNAISDMTADGEGGLWIATASGISRMRRDSIITHGLGRSVPGVAIERGTIRTGTAGEVWMNHSSRQWLLNDPPSPAGEPFVGEMEIFTLGRSRDKGAPQVVIDPSRNEVSEAGTARVSWSGKDAWHETAADELEYSWRTGDGEWSAFRAQTQVVLQGLKPGKRKFEVRCRDLDGNISVATAGTVLSMPYPAWRQPWFLFTVGLLLAVIVWFAWSMLRLRERHILAESRMKLDFYTRISHELSTPLTVVISTLENWQGDPSLKRLDVPLERALRNAWRLQRMFDDIMALRKAEEGRLVLNFTEGDVGGIVGRAVESLRPTAMQGDVRLDYDNAAPGLRMMLDDEQLRRVVANLVSNAIKFTPAQGSVRVRLREDPAASAVVIEVEDDGIGISPEDLPHVFEQYYRSGGSFAARTKGTGVGMAVVREIIDHWGGKIDVHSPVENANGRPAGTLILVKLPLP